ncbi:TetR/AcrR family transcriptional regulator [Arthrobacter sp.]|uniref:TetR/AcrR family transcriptional regulator n=1 Tax=Arthrobacter sp. TaxID=1667 RepID=UPI0026E0CDCC|nr:TetR/AcrR family transcriptional regulator [Arthrobacter sp.]MDO5753345.1 TetR/AcrR family transcriptional regulator [Arthrobacter sp.]
MERREAKLAAILIESWRLADRDGLAAISLRDLADAVGLRQPSLYVYFASKADLYDAMFADGYRELLEFIGARRHDGPPQQALARFVADCVQFSSVNVVRHQLLFQRTIPGFEPSPQSYELASDFYVVAQRLAQAAGVATQSDLDLFSALVSGLAHQQVANDPGGRRWVRLADRVVQMFLADVEQRQQDTITNRRNQG